MTLVSLIRKARKLVPFCDLEEHTEKNYYFEFKFLKAKEKVNVIIGIDNGITKLKKCTCMFHSVKDNTNKGLCSYFLACLFKLEKVIR